MRSIMLLGMNQPKATFRLVKLMQVTYQSYFSEQTDEIRNPSTQILYPSNTSKTIPYQPNTSLFNQNTAKTNYQSTTNCAATPLTVTDPSWYMDSRATDPVTSSMNQLDIKSDYKGKTASSRQWRMS